MVTPISYSTDTDFARVLPPYLLRNVKIDRNKADMGGRLFLFYSQIPQFCNLTASCVISMDACFKTIVAVSVGNFILIGVFWLLAREKFPIK